MRYDARYNRLTLLTNAMAKLKRLRWEGRNGTEFYTTLKEEVYREAKSMGIIGTYGRLDG